MKHRHTVYLFRKYYRISYKDYSVPKTMTWWGFLYPKNMKTLPQFFLPLISWIFKISPQISLAGTEKFLTECDSVSTEFPLRNTEFNHSQNNQWYGKIYFAQNILNCHYWTLQKFFFISPNTLIFHDIPLKYLYSSAENFSTYCVQWLHNFHWGV
jgi:hypothetical protein